MDKNLFKAMQMCIATLVFIIAISITFAWHTSVDKMIGDLEKTHLSQSNLNTKSKTVYINSVQNDFMASGVKVGIKSDSDRIKRILCNNAIAYFKSKGSDIKFGFTLQQANPINIWMDDAGCYVNAGDVVHVENRDYDVDYVSKNGMIVEIIIR